tara:strand:- start:5520 stop:5912 length:393 start_codon:yes stop_codon:yes gene_type:complete
MKEQSIIGIKLKQVLSIFLILLALDAFYLSLFSSFFSKLFKKVQGGRKLTIKYSGFLVTYLFMSAIIYYFGIVKKFTLNDMFLLGISIYGVYELTNYTTFRDWNVKMVLLDTIWGGILFATTLYLLKKLN